MIITESKIIKQALLKRWEEIDLIQSPKADGERYRGFNSIISDAKERAPDMKITQDRLSKYVHKYANLNNWLTETQVMWLCMRYGIPISIVIGDQEVKNGKIENTIPPYNETDCLKKLKSFEKAFKKSK